MQCFNQRLPNLMREHRKKTSVRSVISLSPLFDNFGTYYSSYLNVTSRTASGDSQKEKIRDFCRSFVREIVSCSLYKSFIVILHTIFVNCFYINVEAYLQGNRVGTRYQFNTPAYMRTLMYGCSVCLRARSHIFLNGLATRCMLLS